MCFSATASFAVSGGPDRGGGRVDRSELVSNGPDARDHPLVFAAQQAAAGWTRNDRRRERSRPLATAGGRCVPRVRVDRVAAVVSLRAAAHGTKPGAPARARRSPRSIRMGTRELRLPSSQVAGCVSPFGVRSLVGNVNEWVVRDVIWGPGQSALKGGWWLAGRNRCRHATTHDERYRDFQTGSAAARTRCVETASSRKECAEPLRSAGQTR
jgi:hypothetical protein